MESTKNDKALAAFEKVVELQPTDPNAYVNLALVEISLQRPADAEKYLKKATIVDPKSVLAYTDLANFYRLQNQYGEAERVIQDAVVQNPTASSLYIDWASVLESQGKENEVGEVFEKLRRQTPDSSEAAMAIGDFYFQKKMTEQALGEYRPCPDVFTQEFGNQKTDAGSLSNNGPGRIGG